MCQTSGHSQGNARNGSYRTMQTDIQDVEGWSENEKAGQDVAAVQLGPEVETDEWLLTSGTMSEEHGHGKHVTMREQH